MFNPMFNEDDMVGASKDANLSTGDWIALRRLAQLQSLTESQVDRLVRLGLAYKSLDGAMCTRQGLETLQSRP
jgi:hypothetical protein